jgi:hypothetical protein
VRRLALVGLLALAVAVTSLVHASARKTSPDGLRILVLSNRADLISGGDAYVEIAEPAHTTAVNVHVQLDGHDISKRFARRGNGHILGVVRGMSVGQHRLTASADNLTGAQLSLQNHPQGGPVFSGPQVQPWFCTTVEHGLGPATDAQCDAPARYTWYYMPADPKYTELQPYDPAHPARDVRMTTTLEGHTVPYIVRDETGTSNRGIYDIAVLYDPTKKWEPWHPQAGWNRKAFFRFGSSCASGHVQGDMKDAALQEYSLSRGFAVMVTGMGSPGYNCNDLVGSESLMMLKEHFIENYGQIQYVIGDGCSGGSAMQLLTAANYPGLLNGLRPSCSYSDYWEFFQSATDCRLIDQAFTGNSALWSRESARAAVTGFATESSCQKWENWGRLLVNANMKVTCTADRMPGPHPPTDDWVYDPKTNPRGQRCGMQDYQVNSLGRRPDGFANRPYDNVGVQYGLSALQSGAISVAQFLDLNTRIGGVDIDGNWTPTRSVADSDGLLRAYRNGRVLNTRLLSGVPIISYRSSDPLEYHSDVEDKILSARLDRDTGGRGNQAIVVMPKTGNGATYAFNLMDQWLSALAADHDRRTLAEKVIESKPAAAVDTCFIDGNPVTDLARCARTYTLYSKPRLVAGGPMTDDVLKCQLRPLSRGDYPASMTLEQFGTLQHLFPQGVCDYSRPGVDQVPPAGAWLTFADGPDGRPLGNRPESTPWDGRSGG